MDKDRYWSLVIKFQIVVAIVLLVGITVLGGYYDMSQDEHMMETVNERALEYEADNGTVTDFAEAEIMENDADEKYEKRVWKLEHKELYFIEYFCLAIGIVILYIICSTLAWLMTCDLLEEKGFFKRKSKNKNRGDE